MMLRLFLSALFCLSVAISPLLAKPILFYFKIENATEKKLGLTFSQDLNEKPVFTMIDIRENGEAVFEIDIPFEQLLFFHYGDQRIPMYVQLDDYPEVYFDGQNLISSLRYARAGSENNNLIAQYLKQFKYAPTGAYELVFMQYQVSNSVTKQVSSHSKAQFFDKRNAERAAANALLTGAPDVNPRVKTFLETDLKFTDLTRRITYYIVRQDYDGAARIAELKKEFDPLDAIDRKSEDLLRYEAYRNFLVAALHYAYLPAPLGKPQLIAPEVYDLIEKIADGASEQYLQAEMLVAYINRTGDPSFGHRRYSDFKNQNPPAAQMRKVREAYGNEFSTLASEDAPPLKALTLDGQLVDLDQYRGKVVYISFWASWCKPCLKNFEKSADLRRDLERMGVVLLNVSIDEDDDSFSRTLLRQPIVGINARAMRLDQTKLQYNLNSLPAYYIVDKAGRFAELSARSDRNIREEFRSLVQQ